MNASGTAIRTREVPVAALGGITLVARVADAGVALADLARDHLADLASLPGDVRVSDAAPSPAGPPGSLFRHGQFGEPGTEGHVLVVYAVARARATAFSAAGPVAIPVEALAAALLDWLTEESALILAVDEFRILEELLGSPAPAAFVGAGRSVWLEPEEAATLRTGFLGTLAESGILDDSDGSPAVSPGFAELLLPVVRPDHLAWITWESTRLGTGSAVIGRRDGHSTMLRGTGGDLLRIDALHDIDVADYVARLLHLPESPAPSAEPDRTATTANAARLRADAPERHGLFGIRLVRTADDGLDAADLSWLESPDGSLTLLTPADDPDTLRTAPLNPGALRAHLRAVFEEVSS
jgi:hypothetical protein